MSDDIYSVFAFEETKEDPYFEIRKPTKKSKQLNAASALQKKQLIGLPRRVKVEASMTSEAPEIAVGRENDYGNVEYKYRLVNLSDERREELRTQMKFRLSEGKGQAFYVIGVEDDGRKIGLTDEERAESLRNLEKMSRDLKAEIKVLRVLQGLEGMYMEVMVTRKEREGVIMDIRVALLGAHASGKSTLTGVLTTSTLDNGKGKARLTVCTNRTEVTTGVTTSVNRHILGFDSDGQITNTTRGTLNSWDKVLDLSTKIITLMDMAGHERYAKSVIFGMCSQYPDYALIIIDPTVPIPDMTVDHLQMAFGRKVPVFLVLTKKDRCSEYQMTICMDRVYEELAKYGTDPIVVRTDSDVVLFSRKFVDEKVITPVFEVSCVTGEGLGLLKSFLNNLPNENGWENMAKCSTEFYIDKAYRIEGVGTVVGGIMTKGIINVPEKLFLGPDAQGCFTQVSVLSIHCKRVPVRSVKAGHLCSFHINPDQLPEKLRAGMVLIDVHTTPIACQEFACEVWPVDGGETRKIRLSYQPVVHCQTVRQSVSIVMQGEEVKGEEIPGLEIAPGRRTVLKLRFLHRPEYLSVGNVLMFRDTFMTAMGEVTQVFPLSDIR